MSNRKPATPWMIDQDNARGIVVKDGRGNVVHTANYDDICDEGIAAHRDDIIADERTNAHAMVEAVNALYAREYDPNVAPCDDAEFGCPP